MMPTVAVLLFLVAFALTFVWSDPQRPATVKTSPYGWEQDLMPTVAGNGQHADENVADNITEVRESSGSSPHVTNNVLETTSKCLARNSSETASEEICHGSADDSANVQSVDSYLAFVIGVGINRYVLPVIIVVGSFGNIISILVMFQRQNRHRSLSIYLGNLAISDNCVLFAAGYYWVAAELQGRTFVDVECKILTWIVETFQQNGVLLILSVTLDRLVAVRFPLEAAAWCRSRRAKIVSVSVFAVVSAYNIPHLVFSHADKYLMCMLCSFDNILCVIHISVTGFITFVLPFILLLAMNTIIISALRSSLKYQSNICADCSFYASSYSQNESTEISFRSSVSSASRDCNQIQLSPKNRNLIAMLLLVNFMFLLLKAPRFIRFIVFATVQFEPTPERIALNTLAWHVTNKLYFTSNACNFFLYCVSGSKFRRDFKALFRENASRCCCCCTKTTDTH
ncbi:hypothetical protein LSAT2_000007 [Lamellibrachia satsuma]|nr:hypothetical protein LSAT2_000007 [Lamellibrachia satsuma]